MKVQLNHATGGYVSVDIEMTDTPINIIEKAVEQNNADDVKVIFEEGHLEKFKSSKQLDTTISSIFLVLKDDMVPLEWDMPVGEQIKEQLHNLSNEGRDIKFQVSVNAYVA